MSLPRFLRIKEDTEFDYSLFRKCYTDVAPNNGTNITSLNDGSEITFAYTTENKFYHLADDQTGFIAKIAFRTRAGANLPNAHAAEITLVNNWFAYLFSNIRFNLGTKEIESIDNPGIVSEVLNHMRDENFRLRNGESEGFIPDTSLGCSRDIVNVAAAAANAVPDVTPNNDYNEGFVRRFKKYNYTVGNDALRYCEVFIPLSSLFGCCTERKILKTINFQIRLRRQPNADYTNWFYGADATDVHFSPTDGATGLIDLKLRVVDYIPAPNVVQQLNGIFASEKINWTFCKRELYRAGEANTNAVTINYSKTSSDVPKLVLCVVKGTQGDAQQQDDIERNYSLCRHANIQEITVRLDNQNYPDLPQNSDFLQNSYAQFYEDFKKACVNLYGTECALSMNEYRDLYTIFAVNTDIKELKTANAVSSLTVQIKRRAVPANNNSPVNPQHCDYFLIHIVEKSFNINCAQKLVEEA